LEHGNINEVIKYLETLVRARKNMKSNYAESKVEGFKKFLNRIMDSELKISQKINILEICIASRLNFNLMNSQSRVDDVQRLGR
jgi:uncharacterized glyoxalase superfamily protein PhnB